MPEIILRAGAWANERRPSSAWGRTRKFRKEEDVMIGQSVRQSRTNQVMFPGTDQAYLLVFDGNGIEIRLQDGAYQALCCCGARNDPGSKSQANKWKESHRKMCRQTKLPYFVS